MKFAKTAKITLSVIVVLIVQIFLWLGIFYFVGVYVPRNASSTKPVFVEVPAGSSVTQIGTLLHKKAIISSGTAFNIYTRFSGKAGRLIPGTYIFRANQTVPSIVNDLAAGKVAARKVTVPEGYTITKIARLWEQAGFGPQEQFLTAAAQIYTDSFLPATNDDMKYQVEGYLAPATYQVVINATPQVFIRQMLDAHKQQVAPQIRLTSGSQLKSAHEVLTLASIVEREANDLVNRRRVAGVFLNRLRLGIPLQSDVTVDYATGKSVTSAADTLVASPYNTYKIKSLPPGPIGSPSSDAILAVLNPTSSDDIFFLAAPDGQVYYAKTLAGHNQNIDKYLK